MILFARLFLNEIYLWFLIKIRYMPEMIMGYIITLMFFMGIFYGVGLYADQDADKLDTFIIGMVIWMFAVTSYSGVSDEIDKEVNDGTFDKIYVTQHSLWYIIMVRAVVDVILGMANFFPFLFLFMWISSRWLDIDYFTMLSSMLLAAPSLLGVGYFLGGLFLLMKNTDTLKIVVQLLIVGLILLSAHPLNYFAFLPFVLGSSISKLAVNYQYAIQLQDAFFIGINSLVYLSCGILFFNYCENIARRKGTLCHS
ncbi:hypothetical protein [Alteromonas gilva]|uniref:ABC transporter n=1 Tax=Alteromonas gilva TaxID=2987522 RepID=A0ABT5L441_9ALTE|nr:hypothetical protein [Alteromonas gilva]MDC8831807.1 hypothetical protein [Alteromonas gilva]